ncbi:NADPH:quinone reductase [Ferrithrix thermotolerans DSM 19514]|uniref:NADPH:quinone reductase n=1 Tax=Ferrithrix thermotolerans DSM 19514 TaxID=1121881 RepID=A0A1M4UKK3_9ACTN|nr:NADP-dependent oxidoreductase [Ferrithrix thermotolerans]SHE57229.1 NADPH:quinone reductase [Ferrithrix thermotolerans DSM 19514]
MRAVFYETFGDPDVLQVGEIADPKVGPDSVLVKVHATSVNPVDWKIMKGYLQSRIDCVLPIVPGWDLSGVVQEVGASVYEFEAGDEVYGYVRMDYVKHGTYASYASVPVRTLAKKPKSLSFLEAGVFPLAGLTAYQGLVRHLALRQGETVLVSGGAGGVGVFAIQIAQKLGARVVATASEHNFDLLRSLGAAPVPYGEEFVGAMADLGVDRVDAFFDLYGGQGLQAGLSFLGDKSRVASVADSSVREHGGRYVFVRPSKDDLDALSVLSESGDLKALVSHNFPFEKSAEAFELSMQGHVSGKVGITLV